MGIELGDLTGVADVNLKPLIDSTYSNNTGNWRTKAYNELHNLRQISVGDLVIVPPPSSASKRARVLLGVCDKGYLYSPGLVHEDYPHCIGVEWWIKPRWQDLPGDLRNSIRHPPRLYATVFEVTEYVEVLERFLGQQ